MAYARGSVVIEPATFKHRLRPYLIVSNTNRPFFGDRYPAGVITSAKCDSAVRFTSDTLTAGELKTYPSFLSLLSLLVFPDQEFTNRVAQIETNAMETPAEGISKLTEVL